MKFAIVGAGVMGSLVGSILQKAGAEVWLVNSNEAIVHHVKAHGLRFSINGQESVEPFKIVSSPFEIHQTMDVIIFLVKSCYTEVAAQSAQCLAGNQTYIMTLQNGIGNVEILAKYYKFEQILYGILEFAGKTLELGYIKGMISQNSKICFGSTGTLITEEMRQIAALLGSTGINVILQQDIDSEVWIKLRNNSCNVLFGLLRLSMGQALAAEGTEGLMKMVRDEVIAVAQAKGIQFTEAQLEVNGGKTPINPELYAHLPSTAQDMLQKKPTEVEFINGAIFREGQRLGILTPYNEMLYKLVKIIENTYEMQL